MTATHPTESTCPSCASLLAQLRAQNATDVAMNCDACGAPVAIGTAARQRLERQVERRGQKSFFALLRDASLIAERDGRDRPPPSGIVRPGWDGNTGGGARVESTDLTDDQCDAIDRLREGARLRDRLNALRHTGDQEQRCFELFVVLRCIVVWSALYTAPPSQRVVIARVRASKAALVAASTVVDASMFDDISAAVAKASALVVEREQQSRTEQMLAMLRPIAACALVAGPLREIQSPLLLAAHAIELCVLHARVWRGRLYEPNGKRFVDRPTLLRGIRDELAELVATREQRASWRLPDKPKASAEHEQWKAQCDAAKARRKKFAASLEELVLLVWFNDGGV